MCESPFHADWMRTKGFCVQCGDVRYPDAEERELRAEYETLKQAAMGSAPKAAAMPHDFGSTATPTPFPETDAFRQLLQDMAAGDVSIRDGLMKAYEAGRAERA